jgi:hypothetical protein
VVGTGICRSGLAPRRRPPSPTPSRASSRRARVEVRITAIKDNVFHAELVFDGGLTVGSRSSDAIALALRTGSRIVGADEVLEAGGVAVPDEDEDEVERFRKFLEQISPEDFGEEAPGTQPPG